MSLIIVKGFSLESIRKVMDFILIKCDSKEVIFFDDMEVNLESIPTKTLITLKAESKIPYLTYPEFNLQRRILSYLMDSCRPAENTIIIPHLIEDWNYDPFEKRFTRGSRYVIETKPKGFSVKDYQLRKTRRYIWGTSEKGVVVGPNFYRKY